MQFGCVKFYFGVKSITQFLSNIVVKLYCRQVYRGLIKSSQQQFFAAIIICLVN